MKLHPRLSVTYCSHSGRHFSLHSELYRGIDIVTPNARVGRTYVWSHIPRAFGLKYPAQYAAHQAKVFKRDGMDMMSMKRTMFNPLPSTLYHSRGRFPNTWQDGEDDTVPDVWRACDSSDYRACEIMLTLTMDDVFPIDHITLCKGTAASGLRETPNVQMAEPRTIGVLPCSRAVRLVVLKLAIPYAGASDTLLYLSFVCFMPFGRVRLWLHKCLDCIGSLFWFPYFHRGFYVACTRALTAAGP